MAEFMMLMKGSGTTDWGPCIEKLIESGKFRGGSALGNGLGVSRRGAAHPCVVTGFMRFEADDIAEIRALLEGNPVYEHGGEIELLELLED